MCNSQFKTPKLPQKVQSSIKKKDIFYCCEELHLRFHIVAQATTLPRHSISIHNNQVCKKNTTSWTIIVSGKCTRFSELYLLYKSNLNTHKLWWTQGDIKYNPKNVSKWKKKQKKKEIRIPFQFHIWFQSSWEDPLLINLKNLLSTDHSSLNVQVNLSSGTHFYWSLPLTACNIAKSSDIC